MLSEDEKARRLVAADILCAPSLGGESFGLVLLEAMAARTAVVASDIDGYRQAAGDNAVLVPPNDAGLLSEALSDVLALELAVVTRVTGEDAPDGRRRGSPLRRNEPMGGPWSVWPGSTRDCTARHWSDRRCERPYTARIMSDAPGANPPGGAPGRPPGNRGGGGSGRGSSSGSNGRKSEPQPQPQSERQPDGERFGFPGQRLRRQRRTGRTGRTANRIVGPRRRAWRTSRIGGSLLPGVEDAPDPRSSGEAGHILDPDGRAQTEGTEETTAVRANRRRAGILCVTPGLIVGVVVGLVVVAIGLPLIGVAGSGRHHRGPLGLAVAIRPRGGGPVGGCRPSDESEHPRLHNLVDGLCATMGLPRPTICIVDSPLPNAMAVGRDPATALLVVTSGLDQSLALVELEGVLAHELVHVKRRDTLVAGLAVMVTAPWSLVVGTGRGRRDGAFPRRPGAGVLGRSAGGWSGPLSPRDRLGSGRHGQSAAVGAPLAAGCGADCRAHPLAMGRSDGRCRLRVGQGQPRRHRGPGRSPALALRSPRRSGPTGSRRSFGSGAEVGVLLGELPLLVGGEEVIAKLAQERVQGLLLFGIEQFAKHLVHVGDVVRYGPGHQFPPLTG